MSIVLYVAEPTSVSTIGASPPSWMCHALAVEKQLDHRIVELSFAKGEHRSDVMLAKNPRGTIPVLEHDGAIVHEAFAILLYLEQLAPAHLPSRGAAAARALTRLFEAEYVKTAGMTALSYLTRTPSASRDRAILERHGVDLGSELDRWNDHVADGFAAGASLTLADFALFPYLTTFRQLGLRITRWSRLADYHDRLAVHPSFAATRPRAWAAPASVDPWSDSR